MEDVGDRLTTLTSHILGTREARESDPKHFTAFERSSLASPVQADARAYGYGVLYQTPKQLGAPAAHLKLVDGEKLSDEQCLIKDFFAVRFTISKPHAKYIYYFHRRVLNMP